MNKDSKPYFIKFPETNIRINGVMPVTLMLPKRRGVTECFRSDWPDYSDYYERRKSPETGDFEIGIRVMVTMTVYSKDDKERTVVNNRELTKEELVSLMNATPKDLSIKEILEDIIKIKYVFPNS